MKPTVDTTTKFVVGSHIVQLRDYYGLISRDPNSPSSRLFGEISADSDRNDVNPEGFYKSLLSSMFPGGVIRILQIHYPDPYPRYVFFQNMFSRNPSQKNQFAHLHGDILKQFLADYSYPLVKRTILEYACNGKPEELDWWGSVPGLASQFGLQFTFLNKEGIETVAKVTLGAK